MDDGSLKIWLDSLRKHDEKTDDQLKALGEKLHEMQGSLATIHEAIRPKDLHWAVRSILLPLAVAAIAGTVGAVIHLEIVVAGIAKEQTRQSLTAHALLPQDDFRASLPSLASTIVQASKQHISVPASVVTDLQSKLSATDSSEPNFWLTAADFITYRSQLFSSWQSIQLPDCAAKPATGTANFVQGSAVFTHGPLFYRHCKIILDSPATSANLSAYLEIADVVFDHCVVFYDGNPIIIFPVKVARDSPPKIIGAVHFDECRFLFVITKPPAPQGQQLIRTLLTAPNVSVQFHSEAS